MVSQNQYICGNRLVEGGKEINVKVRAHAVHGTRPSLPSSLSLLRLSTTELFVFNLCSYFAFFHLSSLQNPRSSTVLLHLPLMPSCRYEFPLFSLLQHLHSFISSENWLWLVFVLLFLVRIWEIWGSGWSVSRVLGTWWICRQTSLSSIICSSFCWLETLGSGKVVFFWASPLRLSMISLLRSVIPTPFLLNCLISTNKVVGESFLLEDCGVIKRICIYFVYLFVRKAIQIIQSLEMPLMEGARTKNCIGGVICFCPNVMITIQLLVLCIDTSFWWGL